jgi:hypothetical protein
MILMQGALRSTRSDFAGDFVVRGADKPSRHPRRLWHKTSDCPLLLSLFSSINIATHKLTIGRDEENAPLTNDQLTFGPSHFLATSMTFSSLSSPLFPHPPCPRCTLGRNSSYIWNAVRDNSSLSAVDLNILTASLIVFLTRS